MRFGGGRQVQQGVFLIFEQREAFIKFPYMVNGALFCDSVLILNLV
jgi:hypothetical protein